MSAGVRMRQYARTKRPIRQARAVRVRPVRRSRSPRLSPRAPFGALFLSRRAPFAAFFLSMLVLLAPELTLAPLQAVEPGLRPQPIDQALLPAVPHLPPALSDRRTAGPVEEPVAVQLADAPRYQAALGAGRAHASAWGVTFAAVRDGQLLWAGTSGRARDGQTELKPDSELVIGSVTKTYVAATILQLVDEGALTLDDPVRAHLPAVRLSDAITVRQLMNHTSGLADVFNDTTKRGLEEHPEHAWTAAEIFESLHEPWYGPGEGYAYANTNYYLLAMIVERLTGETLADELERRFLRPLGLDATHLLSPTDPASPLQPAWTTIFWGSGAMTASAADLARWGDALYGGELLQPETRAAMLTLHGDDYGLGVQRVDVPQAAGIGHTGLLNTYTTLLYYLPSVDVTMALLVNRSHVDLIGTLLAQPPGGPSLFELATGLERPAWPPPTPTPSPSPSPSPSTAAP